MSNTSGASDRDVWITALRTGKLIEYGVPVYRLGSLEAAVKSILADYKLRNDAALLQEAARCKKWLDAIPDHEKYPRPFRSPLEAILDAIRRPSDRKPRRPGTLPLGSPEADCRQAAASYVERLEELSRLAGIESPDVAAARSVFRELKEDFRDEARVRQSDRSRAAMTDFERSTFTPALLGAIANLRGASIRHAPGSWLPPLRRAVESFSASL